MKTEQSRHDHSLGGKFGISLALWRYSVKQKKLLKVEKV